MTFAERQKVRAAAKPENPGDAFMAIAKEYGVPEIESAVKAVAEAFAAVDKHPKHDAIKSAFKAASMRLLLSAGGPGVLLSM